jgi:hypothetical protein
MLLITINLITLSSFQCNSKLFSFLGLIREGGGERVLYLNTYLFGAVLENDTYCHKGKTRVTKNSKKFKFIFLNGPSKSLDTVFGGLTVLF